MCHSSFISELLLNYNTTFYKIKKIYSLDKKNFQINFKYRKKSNPSKYIEQKSQIDFKTDSLAGIASR